MKTMLYTYPLIFDAIASFKMSMFFFGVRILVIDSVRVVFTVCLIDVKDSVFFAIKD
jgi:hypothetical protein